MSHPSLNTLLQEFESAQSSASFPTSARATPSW